LKNTASKPYYGLEPNNTSMIRWFSDWIPHYVFL